MKLLLNPNEIVASPRQGVSCFRVICSDFGVWGVNNVLDALGGYMSKSGVINRESLGTSGGVMVSKLD